LPRKNSKWRVAFPAVSKHALGVLSRGGTGRRGGGNEKEKKGFKQLKG